MIFETTLELGVIGEQTVEVHARYYRGYAGSRDEPPEPESYDITKVVWRGVNIYSDLSDDTLNELEAEAKARDLEAAFDAAVSRAEAIREERLLERSAA